MRNISSARTVFLGQFRLVRLQVVNWGTFCGYKDLPIDERGVLLTGPSGSGKSSLMDAHSIALLPTHDQRFNASADLTARGAKQSTRSVADYVRGAWSQTSDENDMSQVQYLRGGKPTWSAVAATYDNGLGAVTTAVVVRWFSGVENDGSALKPMYQLHDGHFDISLLREWADREFDTKWLKTAYPAHYPPSQASYMNALTQRVGLGGSQTGLALLGKAKAMKNVGDLNLFIRENMLDEPDTFAAAQRVVEAFTPLNEAYETASRAHAQAQILREVPANWTLFHESGTISERAAHLLGSPVDHYLRGVHLQLLDAELERLDQVITALDQQLSEQEDEQGRKYEAFRSLDDQYRQSSTALQNLQSQLQLAGAEAAHRRDAYRIYSGYVTRLQRPCPHDDDSFTTLRGQLDDIKRTAADELQRDEPIRTRALGVAVKTMEALEAKQKELLALQSARTLIPPNPIRVREEIAAGTGVPVADLAYAAELIDIADGQERWRPAAEKVLRNFGLRLLVPEAHKDVVGRFIDEHNMRAIVEHSNVTAVSSHQPPSGPQTLAGKLTVDREHPSGEWLSAQLVRQFDHVCVETASDLEPHRRAVTVRGTVKLPGNHYRKDDRPEVARPSAYILGANTAAKRAALEAEVDQLQQDTKGANSHARKLERQYRQLDAMIEAATQLAAYTMWSQVDHASAVRTVHELEERIEALKADNVDLQRLERQRDDAEREYKAATDTCSRTRTAIEDHGKNQTRLVDIYEAEDRKPRIIDNTDDHAYLDEVRASLDITATVDAISNLRSALRSELSHRRDTALQDRKLALSKVRNAIERFLEQWSDSAPDTSGDAEQSGGSFAALYEEIAERRLPDAMTKFQQMISEDMVPSIGLLQRAIEKATEEIRRRIDMVNAGLRRAEFNPGTNLQIAYKANPPAEIKDFRKAVDDLLRHAPAARRDPAASIAQFRRVRELMTRFTASGSEARRWRTNVLDVRISYTFYGREENTDGITIFTYHNTASNSGGEQEKLVAFCLAAALSYNLADDNSDGRPRFAPLMLDEAFSKSDETYAAQALAVFEEFGFQMIIAAPIRMSGIVEPFIGQAVLVEKRIMPDGAHSNAAYATFGDLAARRNTKLEGTVRAAA
ncbi:ATP-binding protein [Micromonospora parva]|uniref:ATP-binding protein n=1 Tax=Micromonospora parva TaxID=1464048 RepID=UPI0033DCAFAC